MTDSMRVDVESLTRLAVEALRHAGVDSDDAQVCAGILVDADCMGIATHGVVRVPEYVHRLRISGVDAKANVTTDIRSPALAIVDGNNALGTVVGSRALETALDLVVAHGIAYVGCRNSNHFGALAPYALRACDAGHVLIAGTNASTTMAPWGGREARIGNNPLCVAAPCADGEHFILDMAMSVAARGKIRAALRRGDPIPDDWAVDASGRATTDAQSALDGLLRPLAGHKGSGLSMAVDLLSGVLSGAGFLTEVSSWSDNPGAPSRLGHFFIVIDPQRLLGGDAFARAMATFKRTIRDTPAADDSTPVVLPGELEQARRREALQNGVYVSADLIEKLTALTRGKGP